MLRMASITQLSLPRTWIASWVSRERPPASTAVVRPVTPVCAIVKPPVGSVATSNCA